MAWARVKTCGQWLILLLVGAAASPGAHAQEQPTSAPAYHDRYIADGKLAPDISYGDQGYADSGGLARSLRVDAMVTATRAERDS